MTRRAFAALLAAVSTVALGGCSVLSTFATLTPKDPSEQIVRSATYGLDPRQRVDVYGPESPKKRMPIVMFFYGGGWSSGSRTDYGWAARALASRGYMVVVPDYRLVPAVRYPSFVEDCASATRWATEHAAQYGGDPKRVFLTGHSAGAYMAMMLALDDRFLRNAGVDFADVKGAVGLSGPYDFYPFDVQSSRNAFGAYPKPAETQPISYASRPHRPPVLLVQGEQDKLVGPYNSVHLDRALRAAGNPSNLHLYPGLAHADTVLALSIPFRRKAPILAEVTGFLDANSGS